jgi:hypothetical protein
MGLPAPEAGEVVVAIGGAGGAQLGASLYVGLW